jgi:hypothetical protein
LGDGILVQVQGIKGGGGSTALGRERRVTPTKTARRKYMGILGSSMLLSLGGLSLSSYGIKKEK